MRAGNSPNRGPIATHFARWAGSHDLGFGDALRPLGGLPRSGIWQRSSHAGRAHTNWDLATHIACWAGSHGGCLLACSLSRAGCYGLDVSVAMTGFRTTWYCDDQVRGSGSFLPEVKAQGAQRPSHEGKELPEPRTDSDAHRPLGGLPRSGIWRRTSPAGRAPTIWDLATLIARWAGSHELGFGNAHRLLGGLPWGVFTGVQPVTGGLLRIGCFDGHDWLSNHLVLRCSGPRFGEFLARSKAQGAQRPSHEGRELPEARADSDALRPLGGLPRSGICQRTSPAGRAPTIWDLATHFARWAGSHDLEFVSAHRPLGGLPRGG